MTDLISAMQSSHGPGGGRERVSLKEESLEELFGASLFMRIRTLGASRTRALYERDAGSP